jgi:RimJ/RimL family protein N-acetyltransferase
MVVPQPVMNWMPRALMYSPTVVGRFVRIDPLNIDGDIPMLWDALGGNDGKIIEHLKWFGKPDLMSQEDLSKLLQSFQEPPDWCVNAFRLVSTDQVVGMASYMNTRSEHGSTEVGLVGHGRAMLCTPAATEAHYLLAKHAFETMGYRRYEWTCDALNSASNRSAQRYGFTFEGCFRQHIVTARGNNRDTNWYSMIDSEWPQRKAAFEAWLDPSNFGPEGDQKRKLKEIQDEFPV